MQVSASNLRTGNRVKYDVNSSGEYAINLADDAWVSDYANGDVIVLTAQGGRVGTNTHTVDISGTEGQASLNITVDTDAQPTLVV